QPSGEIRDRDREDGGALEVAERLDLPLGILILQLLHGGLQLARQRLASRQRRQQPLVDQLIEQKRVGGDLPDQELAVAADLDEPRARRLTLAQQREVRRAFAGGLEDGDDPA